MTCLYYTDKTLHRKIIPGSILPSMAQKKIRDPKIRPFLKWAGGKTQLLDVFLHCLPEELKCGAIKKYIEPFLGGGAVFFTLTRQYNFNQCTVCDTNGELVLTYRVIQNSLEDLIDELGALDREFNGQDIKGQEDLYYSVRDAFNKALPKINFSRFEPAWIKRAAQVIFLNRTCFNGLFRVNQNGEFNVPFGRYKEPDILNEQKLRNAAAALRHTKILHGDFSACKTYADDTTFVYLDPPYRPLNRSSSFTSYSAGGFSDSDQERLAEFFRQLDEKGVKIMLSNSDPRNEDPYDSFFDDLYAGYTIQRVPARRRINSNGAGRGCINELVITNYPVPGLPQDV